MLLTLGNFAREAFLPQIHFKVFYHTNETEEEASSSRLAAALISENQEAIEVPEAMVIEKRLPDLLSLLESYVGTTTSEIPVARKSTEASVESIERQAQEQLQHLREAESQLAIARTTISKLKKELNQKNKEVSKVEQATYEQGQKETKSYLKSQNLVVCHSFCLQTWVEALNTVGVDPSSELRNSKKGFEVATKTSQVEESSSANKAVPFAPTPTNETQPSREAGKQKTPDS
nr:hypothetical protein CFP56_40807 [Quercus suber]